MPDTRAVNHAPDNTITPLEQVKAHNAVDRSWSGILTPSERALLGRILTLTIGWQRTHVITSDRALVGGGCGMPPLKGVSLRTAKTARASLREWGLIRTSPVNMNQATRYEVCLDTLLCEWDENHMPKITPKAGKIKTGQPEGRCKICPTPVQNLPHPGADSAPLIKESLSRNLPQGIPVASAPVAERTPRHSPLPEKNSEPGQSVPFEALARLQRVAQDKAESNRQARRDKASTPRPGRRPNYSAVWRAAWEESQPGVPLPATWGKREQGAMGTAAKKWSEGEDDFVAFLRFAVQQWAPLIRTRFSWMKDTPPPTRPNPMFFVRFMDRFADAYADHRAGQFVTDATANLILRKMAEGYSFEEAAEIIGEKAASRKLSKRHEQAVRALQEQLAMASKAAQANAAPTYSRENPHPRSAVARKPAPPRRTLAEIEQALRQKDQGDE
jgi:hypothetical protein